MGGSSFCSFFSLLFRASLSFIANKSKEEQRTRTSQTILPHERTAWLTIGWINKSKEKKGKGRTLSFFCFLFLHFLHDSTVGLCCNKGKAMNDSLLLLHHSNRWIVKWVIRLDGSPSHKGEADDLLKLDLSSTVSYAVFMCRKEICEARIKGTKTAITRFNRFTTHYRSILVLFIHPLPDFVVFLPLIFKW